MKLTDLKIHQIEFILQAETHFHLGAQAGSQFRGALWGYLQRLACTDPANQDDPLHSQYCPACYLLSLEAHSPRGQNPPRPFVIRPPLSPRAEDDRYYTVGQSLTLGINLLGSAVNLFPYIAQAVLQMGRGGVGYGRGRFSIQAIQSVHPITRKRTELMVDGKIQLPCYPLTQADIDAFINRWATDTISLRFRTPTQINFQGTLQQRPQFDHLISRLLERLEAITYHYTASGSGLDWSETYQSLVECASHVTPKLDNTRWIQVKGGSRRANRLQDLSGFVGDVIFAGNIEPFLPYLLWGQAFHIGKNTVKGNGWYDILADSRFI